MELTRAAELSLGEEGGRAFTICPGTGCLFSRSPCPGDSQLRATDLRRGCDEIGNLGAISLKGPTDDRDRVHLFGH